ncbi:MAG TPA: tRNA pseudouridine(38-40) synthase TruA [Flavisolibacter sp.]|nr:tRNA pseudouridine(38-40) synthase TruA [Flavisolibacter sp.]
MARYFIEVSYKGTRYSGFQVQENAHTIQSEIEKALATICRQSVSLTGSSRTDAGVHARQNFFHFDHEPELHPQLSYKLNALLPRDISVQHIFSMPQEAHSRFHALSRRYRYYFYTFKNPFQIETAHYFPFKIDFNLLGISAEIIKDETNFFAFAKTNSAVKNFTCAIMSSEWKREGPLFYYEVEANRFLRGMVRLLTATQLKMARGIITEQEFRNLFREERKCSYSLPPTGLFLESVNYPDGFFARNVRNV